MRHICNIGIRLCDGEDMGLMSQCLECEKKMSAMVAALKVIALGGGPAGDLALKALSDAGVNPKLSFSSR